MANGTDIPQEAHDTYKDIVNMFHNWLRAYEKDESSYSEETLEEIESSVYGIRVLKTLELQLAGGGPDYRILCDIDNNGHISNIRFKYAWWSAPFIIEVDNYDDEMLFKWFIHRYMGDIQDFLENGVNTI
jgi:transcriptional regulator with XRE-family HTH domain|tara:strand:+ start:42 stop:431 length:390 start_codon:yes stop_codon:yes gene_type:complete